VVQFPREEVADYEVQRLTNQCYIQAPDLSGAQTVEKYLGKSQQSFSLFRKAIFSKRHENGKMEVTLRGLNHV